MKAMKKLFCFLGVLTLCMGIFVGCGSSDDGKTNSSDDGKANSSDSSSDMLSGKHHVEIEVEGYGTIKAELDADTAPITVTNFVDLANEGFYDGLTFMRVINGFMIQGGDPDKNCTGGSDKTIKGEFSGNGVENNISHVRGTLSMARSSNPDSASSQFFIMQADDPSLDGQYAAFGSVTDGIDIVDQICADATETDANGLITDISKQPVITKIKVVD